MTRTKATYLIWVVLYIFCIRPQLFSQEITNDEFYDLSLQELRNVQVFTPSRQKESLVKTPVPTTVITREMIDAIGARNIKEVLTTYVPGMTAVEDHNEMNVSMRGVYASSQQKILFMVNGHRLNSRAYSMANPDYGFSLDKVKQIEVIRGPGSSLYGNISLAGVVNIITMKGADLEGTELRVGAGNHGQTILSAVAGASLGETRDIFVWGYRYDAKGEKRAIDAADDFSSNTTQDGHIYLGGAQGNYDIGVQTQIDNFDFLFNVTRGKYQSPFSDVGVTGEIYDMQDYDEILGEEPGLGQEMTRLRLGYGDELGSLNIKIDMYADQSRLFAHSIASPVSRFNMGIGWWDRDLGGIVQSTYEYERGNILIGSQVDWMSLYDSFFAASTDSSGVLNTFLDTSVPLMEEGKEIIYSGFTQWKHDLSDRVLLNAGFRYDNKDRHDGPNVDAFSPRLSVIAEISNTHNVKVSFARSFVDAPYWYRYNGLISYTGSRDLKPEKLETFQIGSDARLMDGRLFNNLNVFYQSLFDNIYREPTATGDEPRYINAGELKSWGIEEQASLSVKKLDLLLNATYQYALNANDYEVDGSKIANVPAFSANVIGTYKFTESLFFNLGIKYLSSQFSPITAVGTDVGVPDNYEDEAVILNAGLNAKIKKLTLDLRIRNLTNTDYNQGGSTRFAYPQQGRWFTASLKYTIQNEQPEGT